MLLSKRITMKSLADFSRRVGSSIEAGLDLRTIIRREATSGAKSYSHRMARIRDKIERGGSFAKAVKDEGNYFPPQFQAMVEVGERTGRLDMVLLKTAAYYERLHRLRGIFLISILWPAVQLFVALGVVALLIWVTEFIAQSPNEAIDILGFGLVGTRGLILYLSFVAVCLAIVGILIAGVRRGYFVNTIGHGLMYLPVVGPALRLLAQLRFARTLGLSIDAGLDAWNAVDLAFRSTQAPFFTRHADQVKRSVRAGTEINTALTQTDAFSQSLVDAVQIGEQSGRLAESLETHARQLDNSAATAFQALAFAAAVVVWAIVAAFIIFLIFRVAGFYFNLINDALGDL
jgi:type II secretory pathway component PulF